MPSIAYPRRCDRCDRRLRADPRRMAGPARQLPDQLRIRGRRGPRVASIASARGAGVCRHRRGVVPVPRPDATRCRVGPRRVAGVAVGDGGHRRHQMGTAGRGPFPGSRRARAGRGSRRRRPAGSVGCGGSHRIGPVARPEPFDRGRSRDPLHRSSHRPVVGDGRPAVRAGLDRPGPRPMAPGRRPVDRPLGHGVFSSGLPGTGEQHVTGGHRLWRGLWAALPS